MTDPLSTFAAAVREIPLLEERLRRLLKVSEADAPPAEPLPAACRPDLRRVLAAIATAESLEELQELAERFSLDLRDLREVEMAWCEGLARKTVAHRREIGEGPPYRCEGGTVSYPVADYWRWRRDGRQTRTAQKICRGRRFHRSASVTE